jgi:hypothetical protein
VWQQLTELSCGSHGNNIQTTLPLAGVNFRSNSHIDSSIPAVFDAFLYRDFSGYEQLELTIKLRINLRRLENLLQLGYDTNPFLDLAME